MCCCYMQPAVSNGRLSGKCVDSFVVVVLFFFKRLSRFQLFSNASHYLIIRVCQHVAKSYSFFFFKFEQYQTETNKQKNNKSEHIFFV